MTEPTERTTKNDPQEQAVRSAQRDHWTLRPSDDVRRLVCRAIKEYGRDKRFWIMECLRAGLAKYKQKKDDPPCLLRPTDFNNK